MTDPVKVVEAFVGAVTMGDVAAAAAILSEDFMLHHTTRLPYRGVYRGRAGFIELLQRIGAYWESFEPTPGQQLVRDGDGVVVVGELCGKPRHRDEDIAIRVLERYAVKDGHITTIWPFYIDTHLTEEQVSP
jgi:ketosteroid isomerase-like protein